jgi:hypothetical protein
MGILEKVAEMFGRPSTEELEEQRAELRNEITILGEMYVEAAAPGLELAKETYDALINDDPKAGDLERKRDAKDRELGLPDLRFRRWDAEDKLKKVETELERRYQ